MKKIALTSLLAVFAVSGAHAANVINNNPLYRPEAGQFYSVTSVGSHTEEANAVGLTEEFGYGITDRLAIGLATSMAEADWFDASLWNTFGIGLNFRALDMGNWKGDVFASYGVGPMWGHKALENGHDIKFLDKDLTNYTWTVGMRGGYATDMWTVAGHVAFDYTNSESFNWDDSGLHKLRFGLDGQLVLNQNWNLIAGVEYNADYDNWSDNEGYWTGKFGANYNFDSNKFIGAYITKLMYHDNATDESGKWTVDDGFGFGATFGIQF